MLGPVCTQFYLSLAAYPHLFMFPLRDIFESGAIRPEFGTEGCLRASTSLIPCALSPATSVDTMLKEEAEMRQIPAIAPKLITTLVPRGSLEKVTKFLSC